MKGMKNWHCLAIAIIALAVGVYFSAQIKGGFSSVTSAVGV